ncbi:MAG: N-formylglutamate amidohydrolase [Candidatus Sedimenticola sp. PURPLELP]
MSQATELNATSSPLLLPGDPPAWELLNGDSDNGMVILCDHARNLIPTALDSLGLDKDQFDNHIAYDIGAEDTARRLADLFRCRLFISGYSRLVIDLNRHPGDGSSIPEVSDDIEITGNRGLTTEEIICRENELFWAYHNRVSQELQQIASAGLTPLILSLHSFTPTYRGYRRPWHVGVLWDRDQRISAPLLQRLSALPDICAGDNEPYHARSPLGYTMEVHCEHNGFPHVLLELRQDLIESREGACHWGEFIHRHLSAVLDETGLLTTTDRKPGRP